MPGVEWAATDAQQAVIEELRSRQTATARELAEATGVSKRHVARTLTKLREADRVTCREDAGRFGATLYKMASTPPSGVADLKIKEITTSPVWDSHTWAVAIDPVQVVRARPRSPSPPPSELRAVSLAAFQDGPPPE